MLNILPLLNSSTGDLRGQTTWVPSFPDEETKTQVKGLAQGYLPMHLTLTGSQRSSGPELTGFLEKAIVSFTGCALTSNDTAVGCESHEVNSILEVWSESLGFE